MGPPTAADGQGAFLAWIAAMGDVSVTGFKFTLTSDRVKALKDASLVPMTVKEAIRMFVHESDLCTDCAGGALLARLYTEGYTSEERVMFHWPLMNFSDYFSEVAPELREFAKQYRSFDAITEVGSPHGLKVIGTNWSTPDDSLIRLNFSIAGFQWIAKVGDEWWGFTQSGILSAPSEEPWMVRTALLHKMLTRDGMVERVLGLSDKKEDMKKNPNYAHVLGFASDIRDVARIYHRKFGDPVPVLMD